VVPPNIATYEADPRWRTIDLLSDVHLSADMPRTFDVWARHLLETPADAVLMLGDVFELWVGDDSRHDGFVRECADVLRRASARRTLAFMPGNRDFLVGAELLAECGVSGLADPTVLNAWGQRLLLTHGDALCLDDQAYQRFRVQVRDPAWQQGFLQQPLPQRQAQAHAMRAASEAHQSGMSPDLSTDVDEAAALAWLQAAHATVMSPGHTQRPAQHAMPNGATRHVMGDWDFDGRSRRARMLRLTAAGLQTLDLAARP
jgi:UDP-2,3-diacylglucosamine hydrolase